MGPMPCLLNQCHFYLQPRFSFVMRVCTPRQFITVRLWPPRTNTTSRVTAAQANPQHLIIPVTIVNKRMIRVTSEPQCTKSALLGQHFVCDTDTADESARAASSLQHDCFRGMAWLLYVVPQTRKGMYPCLAGLQVCHDVSADILWAVNNSGNAWHIVAPQGPQCVQLLEPLSGLVLQRRRCST